MAVYTVLERDELQAFVEPFGIGPLLDFCAVADGVENTTYFLSTDHSQLPDEETSARIQHYVLTVFEEITLAELPFYVQVTTVLNRAGLPVPCPLRDYNGVAIRQIADKPALLFPRVRGKHPITVDAATCQVIGDVLARMHVAGAPLDQRFDGCRSPQWVLDATDQVITRLSPADASLMQAAASELKNLLPQLGTLPAGVIHNDLFRDNTLFDGDALTGIIDFYNAGYGALLMDVAIAVNDWCSNSEGACEPALAETLLQAYNGVRPFTDAERRCWPSILRGAALRFWVSRLVANTLPVTRKGALVARKNPDEYRQILVARQGQWPALPP